MRGVRKGIVGTMGILAVLATQTTAKPRYGPRCGACHTKSRSAMTLVMEAPTWSVTAGESIPLTVRVTDGHSKYAVVLYGFDAAGSASPDHHLVFQGDSAWVDYTNDQPPYYASTSSKHSWSGARSFTFDLHVDATTPADTYTLTFEVAGKNGGKWSQRQSVPLEVRAAGPRPGNGDLDHDGDVDGRDFALWASLWGLSEGGGARRGSTEVVPDASAADLDADADVDGGDLLVLLRHWLLRDPVALAVRSGDDDAEESLVDHRVNLTSSDLEMVMETDEQLVGLRFVDVPLDPNAHLAAASLQFTVDETDTGPCALRIEGEAGDQAAAFSARAGDLSGRPRTRAAVPWEVPAWLHVGEAGPAQRSPDLAAIIEEIVARPGWRRGHSLVLLISGDGTRTAESYNGQAGSAPVLHLSFPGHWDKLSAATSPAEAPTRR